MNTDRWQEYDCPVDKIDYDLVDGSAYPMVFEGESFYCCGCWGHHVATPELIQQYERQPDGELRVVPLQRRGITNQEKT